MNKLVKIIGAVAVINIVARLLGFLREVVIAEQYGVTTFSDAIAFAYTIPNFIYLVVGGALTTAFISVYHQTEQKQIFTNRAFTTVLLTAGAFTVGCLIFTDALLQLFFKDLSTEQFTLVKKLFFWMMPSTIFLVLSTWLSGLLNVHAQFQRSSLAILLYNFLFVAVAWGLTAPLGVVSYGVGAMIAALAMVVFLWFGVKKLPFKQVRPSVEKMVETQKMWKLALPILLGGASLQFYFVIHRIAGGMVGEGAISTVNYASKLSSFPQAILMTAVTTVIYPLVSKKEGEGDFASVQALYKKGLLYLVVLLVPATFIAYFFAEPVVSLIFERGEFTAEAVAATTPVFQVFTLSMFFLAANTFVTRFYYAKGDSIRPVVFSLIAVFGINIGIMAVFLPTYGALAIAYGTVISSAVNFLLLIGYAQIKWKKSTVEKSI